MYIYLDHNIYISALDNPIFKDYLKKVDNQKHKFLYSPAHVEEAYNAFSNADVDFQNKIRQLMELIGDITNRMELLPRYKGITVAEEPPIDCLKRVAVIDTRSRIKQDGEDKYFADKANFASLLKQDKNFSNLSNFDCNEIWNHTIIKSTINAYNENRDKIIVEYNNSADILQLLCINVDKRLPTTFCFERGNYYRLANSFTELEYSIEILFRILNHFGYYREKKPNTAISATHDVSHAIYATKTDFLITMDERFYNKCKAVYSYLGVPTNLFYIQSNATIDTIINTISKILL